MPRTKKPKQPTKAELRLLTYPPTPLTWVCGCEMVNSGTRTTCSQCRRKKPRKPKLLWPQYVRACKKVGIDPDERKRYRPKKD